VVTNGYINPEPLQELSPLIDAWNIDVKAIRQDFYKDFCGARLEPVLETVRLLAPIAHVELTHLLVTEGHDREEDITELVNWVASVSPEIPLHLSRYFPQYRWYAAPTDLELMQRAYAIAKRKLAWVYMGNVGAADDSTYCPDCHTLLISRRGYHVEVVRVKQGQCPQCHRKVPGIFAD
jgi:pyruvate formate lyase activating enzyme